MGEIAHRLGQPSVVGEIFAGIILGPSILGNFSCVRDNFIPNIAERNYLDIISLIGAMFLLFIAGMETDIKLIKHHSKRAFIIAISALLVSFISVFIFGLTIPANLLVDPDQRLIFSFFLATVISVSAISVMAKVLIDLKLIRRDIGQLTVAIGMIDETVVWILVSIIIGLLASSAVDIGNISFSFIKVILFLILGFAAGKFIVKYLIYFIQTKIKIRDKFLTLVVIIIFLFGAMAQAIGLEAVLGAFIAGVVFGQIPNMPEETIGRFDSMTFAIFAPIFFAAAGLKVNIVEFTDTSIIYISVALLFLSFFSKGIGAYIGSRYLAGSDHWTALSFSVGLNTRGTIQIIIATIGLSLNIITQDIFSIIIIISVLTSIVSPVLLKAVLKKVTPEEQETSRLKKEEIQKGNIISRVHRILLPVRTRKNFGSSSIKMLETKILERISAKKEIQITLLTVTNEEEKTFSNDFLNGLEKTFSNTEINKKVIISKDPLDSILEEAKKDYDLLIVGATEKPKNKDMIFNTFVDNLIRFSPCPSIVVQGHSIPDDWKPKRILVPTNGSLAAKRAAEVAFALASNPDDEVHILKVIKERHSNDNLEMQRAVFNRQYDYATQIVNELKEIGDSFSVNSFTKIEFGRDPEIVILNLAKENKFDLVVLGTDIRPGSDRLYLGQRVERIISDCVCPVIVVNSY